MIHIHSTLDVKNSHKQMDVWTVSTKNTVSKTKTLRNKKNIDNSTFSRFYFRWNLLFLRFDHTFDHTRVRVNLILSEAVRCHS
ncbi:predicted protein [Enterococcus gallinarum EG2]|nr:predicted protein [Enterococcus gallinarum EG2]